MSSSIKVFWWGEPCCPGVYNFGDLLTPMLLNYYLGEDVALEPVESPELADCFCVGSIVENVPQNRFSVLLGCGMMYGWNRPLPKAHAYAVRGCLTRDILGLDSAIPLGDPGLLAPIVFPLPEGGNHEGPVGIVPHYMHYDSPRLDFFRKDKRYKIINVRKEAKYVIEDICSCSAIVSSSLHGLIIADAYKIPNKRLVFNDGVIQGGDFKYDDYYSSINRSKLKSEIITPEEISDVMSYDVSYFDRINAVRVKLDAAFRKFAQDIPLLNKCKAIEGELSNELEKMAEQRRVEYIELYDKLISFGDYFGTELRLNRESITFQYSDMMDKLKGFYDASVLVSRESALKCELLYCRIKSHFSFRNREKYKERKRCIRELLRQIKRLSP